MLLKQTRYSCLVLTGLTWLAAGTSTVTAAAQPEIGSFEGSFQSGQTITIRGHYFSEKRNAKPLLWWTADGGTDPSLLGRISSWGTKLNGTRQNSVVAPGSNYSYAWDHGASGGAALGRVDFASNRIYLWRKKYDDFDQTNDFAIRTRTNNMKGVFSVGQVVTGQTSGATGIVQSISGSTLFYERTGGSINEPAPLDFIYGEVMKTDTGSAENREGSDTSRTGTFRSFNNKTLRFWGADGNNCHTNGGYPDTSRFKVTPEFTQGTLWYQHPDFQQSPRVWNNEQLVYESSDVGIQNGRWWFAINNLFTYSDLIISRDSVRPSRYSKIFQSQVSNGAQPGSYVYYDALYIDDSWHRVLVSSHPTWDTARDVEVQIPVQWADNQVEFVARVGSLGSSEALYLYIVNSDGRVNTNGFPLVCPECPTSPDPVGVE